MVIITSLVTVHEECLTIYSNIDYNLHGNRGNLHGNLPKVNYHQQVIGLPSHKNSIPYNSELKSKQIK